ncbi:lantibiotic dehydratase [Spirosoma sp. SC4-14]|uniref:lantibiotic dehydratase n=1 Tax=Spirosoma sp. SC4-14 TaxID=3128900 RepID=UPI0030D38DCA
MISIASSFYLLRLPALPFQSVKVEAIATSLQHLWETTILAEAVFVASPELYQQVSNHISLKGWPLSNALFHSLVKYALRMSSRATPFGLMSGFSVGQLAESTRVSINSEQVVVRHQRLDMDCMAGLIRHINSDITIKKQLLFFPNNSRYTVGDELRYTERDDTGLSRHYFISSVSQTDYLTDLLQRTETGASLEHLACLLKQAGAPYQTARAFVDELVDSQLLVSELEPMLTGPSMICRLRERLAQLRGSHSLVNRLSQIEHLLSSTTADSRDVYQSVENLIAGYTGSTVPQRLIQTDTSLNTPDNQISQNVIQTILSQLAELKDVNQSSVTTQLTDFSRRFRERYDQQEIPLQLALDSDFGIGYGNSSGDQANYTPLLDSLTIPPANSPTQFLLGPYEQLVLSKFSQALRANEPVIVLTADDLIPLEGSGVPFASSFYVLGNLLSASAANLDRGDFQFNILSAEGPSAANLLGRFCAHSPELTNQVKRLLKREEEEQLDAIFAEIIHWPDDRLGNILVRPVLRDYEIPYISQASVDKDHQIPLDDLLLSVQADGRLVLRSKRYGKEIIPRLSTAHNYHTGLSTYQFLADLQRQNQATHLGWQWGALDNQPFLPRVTYKNLILSRARWILRQHTLPTNSLNEFIAHLSIHYKLPKWIAIADGDNELVLDLESLIGQQLLLDEYRRRSPLRIIEWVATPDQCWIATKDGSYVNELVIPCETRTTPAPLFNQNRFSTAWGAAEPDSFSYTRSFDLGSEWLYVKLYMGVQPADDLLKTVIGPFIEQLKAQNQIELFFFIRYADPDTHLRLRFYSTRPQFYTSVLEQLYQLLAPYRQSGVIYRVQTDTYEREIERYGASAIVDSEQLFDVDSQAILDYLKDEISLQDRWLFALQSCDALLNDFGLSIQAKVGLLQQLQRQFLAEHRADKTLRKELNDRYRNDRSIIDQLLSGGLSEGSNLNAAYLQTRSRQLQAIIDRIKGNIQNTSHQPAEYSLIASYLHMSLNRLFISQQRTHEMVIYHFLARYYESQQARQCR